MFSMRRTLLILFLSASFGLSQASVPAREVRAVWITTVLGLDWPKSVDPSEQQRSLKAIVRELAAARYNTIFFQVRGRGDAMYRSLYEPWSEQLTGTLGKDPGWDPLEVLLDEAHRNGMEVHAWFNTFLVRDSKERRLPGGGIHVVDRHPEWAALANGEWWLDPGIPEVREYIVRVGLDIVRNYDIDGFQFDFLRYPADVFPDDATYRRYGGGAPKADWRRDNVTRLVAVFHDSVQAIKPFVKLGATPLGIYKNSEHVRGLQSYEEVYQDSRGWLAGGLLDYLAPQLYWSIGERPGNPDFATLAREWSGHAYGRQIVLGVGAYKPEVAVQLPQIIDLSRAVGAAGHAFFRYSNVSGLDAVTGKYPYLASAPMMPWKSARPPAPPADVRIARLADGRMRLEWQRPAAPGPSAPLLAKVYRSERTVVNAADPAALIAVVPVSAGEYTDSTARPGTAYGYALSVLDRAERESDLMAAHPAASPELASLGRRAAARTSLGEAVPTQSLLLVPYEVASRSGVAITILDGGRQRVGAVIDDLMEPGRYVVAANIAAYRKGWYTLVMESGAYHAERRFQVE